MSNGEIVFAKLAEWVNDIFISIIKGLTIALWYIEKVTAYMAESVTTASIWGSITADITNVMKAAMPDVIRSIVFGTGGGLLYLALIFVGIFMIVPQLGAVGRKFVELDRVVLWSFIMIALFTASTSGYDLLAGLETARQGMTTTIVTAFAPTGSLGDLISVPMQASAAETTDMNSFELGAAFESQYFPAPASVTTHDFILMDTWITGELAWEFEIEDEASQDNRRSLAAAGVLIGALTLISAYVLVLITLSFVALTAAALVMLIFFLVATPMGLFEFGTSILFNIAQKYTFIWVLTLLISVFPAVLLGVSQITLTGTPDIPNMLSYMAIMIVAVLASTFIARMTINVMMTSFNSVQTSVKAAVSGVSGDTPLPKAEQFRNSAAMKLAMFAAAAPAIPVAMAAFGSLTGAASAGAMATGGDAGLKTSMKSAAHVFSTPKKVADTVVGAAKDFGATGHPMDHFSLPNLDGSQRSAGTSRPARRPISAAPVTAAPQAPPPPYDFDTGAYAQRSLYDVESNPDTLQKMIATLDVDYTAMDMIFTSIRDGVRDGLSGDELSAHVATHMPRVGGIEDMNEATRLKFADAVVEAAPPPTINKTVNKTTKKKSSAKKK